MRPSFLSYQSSRFFFSYGDLLFLVLAHLEGALAASGLAQHVKYGVVGN